MPNWCTNSIHIYGKQEDIADFYSKWSNKKCLQFQDFVPRPEDQEENWFSWNCEHWGTKWDLCDDMTVVVPMDTEIQIETQTAWSPPLKFLETVAAQYPNLTFTVSYHEQGMMFCGFAEWQKGAIDTKLHHCYESLKELKRYLEEYDVQYTEAWWEPSETDLEEEEEDAEDVEGEDEDEDENELPSENTSQEG